ncbi:PTS transporter subunit EIIC [Paenibacillus alvei]|uniref:PTS transporter subunit EIIC n=1 Tax=Paenibacillus alvei TaxID=44250 RepID=A0AAP7A0N1_PAEAL|nr:PTS transporter subunit EIIC [Paenibacillus alvei]NOJ72290.1 PTS transporter subunit EIIC [Paenibacillus alvei]
MSYEKIAKNLINQVGGMENIRNLSQCATRLRFQLVDQNKVNDEEIKGTDLVLGTVVAGGQYQVIIGSKVADVYKEIMKLKDKNTSEETANNVQNETGTKKGVQGIFDIISGSFLPLLGVLAGSGMLKAILNLLLEFNLIDTNNSTYIVLSSISNAVFYFLPILLGFSLSKRLGVNVYIGAVIGASLLEPGFMGLIGNGNVDFLGIKLIAIDYASSVFPVFIAIAFYAKFEKLLIKFIPKMLQMFMVPMISLVVIVPLTMLIFGPFGTLVGEAIANFVVMLSGVSGMLTGAILGGFYTFLIVMGLHWGLVPIVLANLGAGGDPLYAMGGMCAFAQMGIALGFLLRSKNKKLQTLAGSSLIPAVLSGVTEPIIYGLIVPYRKTFIYIMIAGAIGGGINGFFQVKMVSYAFASFLGIPAYSPMLVYLVSAIITLVTAAFFIIVFGYEGKKKVKTS